MNVWNISIFVNRNEPAELFRNIYTKRLLDFSFLFCFEANPWKMCENFYWKALAEVHNKLAIFKCLCYCYELAASFSAIIWTFFKWPLERMALYYYQTKFLAKKLFDSISVLQNSGDTCCRVRTNLKTTPFHFRNFRGVIIAIFVMHRC